MPRFRLMVNGVERQAALSTLSVQHVVNRPDILECDIQDPAGGMVIRTDHVVQLIQTDVAPERVYFEGWLQTKSSETWTGYGFSRLRKITAFDYSLFAQFVDADLTTDGTTPLITALQALVAGHLSEYGVTLDPAQATGPILPQNGFAGVKAEAILGALSEQIGWVWKINALRQLRMWNPAAEPAGFNITAANDTYVHDIKTNSLAQQSYNRVWVEGGEGYLTIRNETLYGDGVSTTFLMQAPLFYYEVDYTSTLGIMVGLTLFVNRGGVGTIEYVNDQRTAHWTFNRGPAYSLTQNAGAVLAPGDYVLVSVIGSVVTDIPEAAYTAQYPMRLVADGRGDPPDPPRDLILKRPGIFNRAALQAIADENLKAYAGDHEEVTYPTRRVDIRPGQTQTINVPMAGVNGTFTCVDARLRHEPGGNAGEFWLEVTAVNEVTARSFWLNLLDRWLGDTRGTNSAGAGAVGPPIPPAPPGIGPHGVTHQAGGNDALPIDSLAPAGDTTLLDVSAAAHGLAPKLFGADGFVLTKAGGLAAWAAPAIVAVPPNIAFTNVSNPWSAYQTFPLVIVGGAAPARNTLHVGDGNEAQVQSGVGLAVQGANAPAQVSARVCAGAASVELGILAYFNSAYFGTWTNHPITFRTNNTDRMTLSADGGRLDFAAGNFYPLNVDASSSLVARDMVWAQQRLYVQGFRVTVTADCTIPSTGGGGVTLPPTLAYYDAANPWSIQQNFQGLTATALNVAGYQFTMTGAPTLGDWFNQSVKTTASPTFANLTVNGTLTNLDHITSPRYDSGGQTGITKSAFVQMQAGADQMLVFVGGICVGWHL